MTNLVIACVFLGIAKILLRAGGRPEYSLQHVVKLFFTLCNIAYINLLLFIFNLIPIPPLDGSRVVGYFLKGEARSFYRSIEPYGIVIILIVPILLLCIFTSLTGSLVNLLLSLFGLPKVFFTRVGMAELRNLPRQGYHHPAGVHPRAAPALRSGGALPE